MARFSAVKSTCIRAFLSGCLLLGLCGCDTITRHEVLTTIFDGVPSLPPPEQLCAEYADRKMAELRDELTGKNAAKKKKVIQVVHPPYRDKECNNCHDKSTQSGFVTPLKELCLTCHKDFIKGRYVHGPVAARDCIFCHDPHSAQYSSLLKKEPNELCATCHREKRASVSIHSRAAEHKMGCIECHNPHYGKAPYFLQ
jgi:predicted CXXCH cytochrome family protein